MPCLVSLTGKNDDFQSLSWATWATGGKEKAISKMKTAQTNLSRLI